MSRKIRASIRQVFAAFEDPEARSKWGPPSDDETLEFIETDFREGGRDVHMCGPVGNLQFRVETHYCEIERPDLLLMTERVTVGDRHLSTSLVSVSLEEAGNATQLDLTVQIASSAGPDFVAATRGWWTAALSNLESMLDEAAS